MHKFPNVIKMNRTLAELRTQLQLRLGFMTTGPAAQHNAPLLEGLLMSAHAHVLLELGTASAAPRTSWLECIEGEALYDLNDDAADRSIDPERIHSLHLYDTQQPAPLHQLHQLHHIGAHIERGMPTHYAHEGGQLRLHPAPDAPYRVAIFHSTASAPFAAPQHRSTAPDELVLLHALAVAKAHYRQPDAQIALSAYQLQIARHKAAQHGNVRYFDAAAQPQPVRTVQRAGGLHYF